MKSSSGGSGGSHPHKSSEGTGNLVAKEVIAPSSGKAIKVYTDGNTIIPIDKN